MLDSLTAKQLRGWEHFAELEPFTVFNELRADYRIASIVQMLANVNRGKKQKAYSLKDFLLNFDQEAKAPTKQTWQEKLAIANVICASYSASDKDSFDGHRSLTGTIELEDTFTDQNRESV